MTLNCVPIRMNFISTTIYSLSKNNSPLLRAVVFFEIVLRFLETSITLDILERLCYPNIVSDLEKLDDGKAGFQIFLDTEG